MICNSHDVKIKILAVRICGSDVHILADPPGTAANPGIILGHECVGEIVDMGEGIDGAFCEYAVVPEYSAAKIPKGTDIRKAIFAEPLACVMNAEKLAAPTPADYVLLYGAGPISLTFIRVLKMFGVRNLIVAAKGQECVTEAKNCGRGNVKCVIDTWQTDNVMR